MTSPRPAAITDARRLEALWQDVTVFDDPALVISCDLPLGWVPTRESKLFGLVLENIRDAREQILLFVDTSLSSAVDDEDVWITAARDQLPATAERIVLAGTTAFAARWREGDVDRERIARRGAGLDLVLDYRGHSAGESTHRALLRLAAGAVLPVAEPGAQLQRVEDVRASVDNAAQEGGETLVLALHRAVKRLGVRWQSSIAGGLESPDYDALAALFEMQARLAIARGSLAGKLKVESLRARMFEAAQERSGVAMYLEVADNLLGILRRYIDMGGNDLEFALICAREIVDAVLTACIEAREGDFVPPEVLIHLGQPLITFIDRAEALEHVQESADAGALLSEQAARMPSGSDADRFALIGIEAQANAMVLAADEASLRDALELLGRTLAGEVRGPELLNMLHLQALAALHLGELDIAFSAAQRGKEAATTAGDKFQFQVDFFNWALEIARASEAGRPATASDLDLVYQRSLAATDDELVNRICSALGRSIEQNPLSLTLLERLMTAARAVEAARPELLAAAAALLDLRRLLIDRNSDLRIGSDDSLLVRQLAAGNVEKQLREAGAGAAALAVDHACSRSLILDLAEEPAIVSRIHGAIREGYADREEVARERNLRGRLATLGTNPPWVVEGAPAWLNARAVALRQWCAELTGVVGGAPLTEAEMFECAERHGEPILLLYPVAGEVGGLLLRPGQPPELRCSGATFGDTLRAVDRLRAELGVWKSARARSPEDWLPPDEAVEDYRVAAADVFAKLLAPVAEELSQESRLTIVPYRELASVPFAVLPGHDGRPLCESLAVTVASSISMLRVLHNRDASQRARTAFILGDPDTGDPHLRRLPGAALEARGLAARLAAAAPGWDVRLAQDEDASPAAYRARAAGCELVHLACHGSVGNVARDAALLLSPKDSATGLLKAADIEAVRLPSALVFLSACRSGSGRPTADGTIGLARAFLVAGADAVVASLWNVPDASTRMLVDAFYDSWLSGVDAASALRHAMIATRDALATRSGSEREVHLAEWGAFFILGRGGLARA